MGLRSIQRDFASWLVAEDRGAAKRLPLANARGLQVYLNNYRAQLMNCLQETYPHTLSWIGEEAFLSSAAEHVDNVPPHSWTLDEYARGFPATLVKRYPADREVFELSCLELALTDAFVAADAVPLEVDRFSQIAWEEAELRLVPSAKFQTLSTNAPAIWSALDGHSLPPAAEVASAPSRLVVWRQGWTCCFQQLDANERVLLPLLEDGVRFETMCQELVALHGIDDGVQLAGELLARWARAGLLLDIDA